MAKGFDKHRARQDALTQLGRTLARRSGSSCELCGESGVPLSAFEVAPVPEDPEADRCVFACEACLSEVGTRKIADPRRWRFLENTVWSEVPAVQVVAVRMLRRLEKAGETWANDILEGLYLAPGIQEWAEEGA